MMDIKQKSTPVFESGVCPGQNSLNILLFEHIVQTVTERDHGIYRFRELPLLHVLSDPAHAALA
ncbi:hypothetical protein D3C87_2129550 [compost metagenome]